MKQTQNGAARTKKVRDLLVAKSTTGTYSKKFTQATMEIEYWPIGKYVYILETFPNGYNLYKSVGTANAISDDLASIECAVDYSARSADSIDVFKEGIDAAIEAARVTGGTLFIVGSMPSEPREATMFFSSMQGAGGNITAALAAAIATDPANLGEIVAYSLNDANTKEG